MNEATVFSVQRFSTEDGPGIRTTVFFKGCPMRCTWCHNPEGIRPKPHLAWFGARCIGCKTCMEICENGGLRFGEKAIDVIRENCKACGDCAEECPSEALEKIGKRYTPKDLADLVLKDATFYETSEGGVTCSGGEPMVQLPFLEKFLPLVREKGVHIALDTCGSAVPKMYDRVLPLVDLVLFDLKIMDSDKHMEYTAIRLDRVVKAAKHIASSGTPMWVRTPLIPGYTDSDENVSAIADFIVRELGDAVVRYDLLAFSNLCKSKYEQLEWEWHHDTPLLTKEYLKAKEEIAKSRGVKNVVSSGPTRLEDKK